MLATLLLLAGVACAAYALRAPENSWADPPAAATARTPVASLRRAPALFLRPAAAVQLERSLQPIVAPYRGCVVAATRNGRTIAEVNPDLPLAPASNAKLLTGLAALDVLSPEHRFTTTAVTDRAPEQGVVAGNLYVVGGGDPVLRTPANIQARLASARFGDAPSTSLDDLATRIADAGVTRIEGDVIGDDSRHERVRYLPDWKPNYRTDGESGPLGALAVDNGFVDPSARIASSDPAALTAQRLTDLLGEHGVTVAGTARSGTAPAGAARVASISSPTLADIVAGDISSSDNYTAELLAREIGHARTGTGTTAAGVDAIADTLRNLGVPVAGLELHDGSGLAPNNRTTCATLAAVIELASRPKFAALDRGLAVAGESGTLALRLRGTPLAGVLRAKTGQIDGVVGLTGLVDDAQHLRFAFLANGDFSQAGGHVLQDQVATAVAAYPTWVPMRDLAPAP